MKYTKLALISSLTVLGTVSLKAQGVTRGTLFLAILTSVMAGLVSGVASATTYSITNNSGVAFEDISTSGTRVFGQQDDFASSGHAIGFTFDFYETPYTTIGLSSNGLATFNGFNNSLSNLNFTTTNAPASLPSLAPFWDDLDSAGGSFRSPNGDLFVQTLGTSGARRFIVQWNRWGRAGDDVLGQDVTFQVRLNEGSNAIDFVYSDSVFGGAQAAFDNGASATVGLSPGVFNDSGNPVAQFSFNAATLSGGQSITFAPVPEPTTTTLVLGLASIGVWVRHRKAARRLR